MPDWSKHNASGWAGRVEEFGITGITALRITRITVTRHSLFTVAAFGITVTLYLTPAISAICVDDGVKIENSRSPIGG